MDEQLERAGEEASPEAVKLKPEQLRFFRFARKNCCNYSERGPLKRRHYCWRSTAVCALAAGEFCIWFEQAVLPLDVALEIEWRRLKGAIQPSTARTCPCGKKFKPRSNRQLRCEECGRAASQEQLRKRKRKQRAK
jgi:hypothetical protein